MKYFVFNFSWTTDCKEYWLYDESKSTNQWMFFGNWFNLDSIRYGHLKRNRPAFAQADEEKWENRPFLNETPIEISYDEILLEML